MLRLIIVVMFAAIVTQGHAQEKPRRTAETLPQLAPKTSPSNPPPAFQRNSDTVGQYKCDGRTHCSQMTSCAEATYFLKHCPGVKMDGDNDGIPCEEQWCKH